MQQFGSVPRKDLSKDTQKNRFRGKSDQWRLLSSKIGCYIRIWCLYIKTTCALPSKIMLCSGNIPPSLGTPEGECTGSCEPGSRCHPNECIFGGEKPRGVGKLELGVYEQGERIGEFSLKAIGDQGGRILSQQGGFQVSERGSERGARGISKGNASCTL